MDSARTSEASDFSNGFRSDKLFGLMANLLNNGCQKPRGIENTTNSEAYHDR